MVDQDTSIEPQKSQKALNEAIKEVAKNRREVKSVNMIFDKDEVFK